MSNIDAAEVERVFNRFKQSGTEKIDLTKLSKNGDDGAKAAQLFQDFFAFGEVKEIDLESLKKVQVIKSDWKKVKEIEYKNGSVPWNIDDDIVKVFNQFKEYDRSGKKDLVELIDLTKLSKNGDNGAKAANFFVSNWMFKDGDQIDLQKFKDQCCEDNLEDPQYELNKLKEIKWSVTAAAEEMMC